GSLRRRLLDRLAANKPPFGSLPEAEFTRASIARLVRQIKKFAPAIGTDVAFHDLAGSRSAEQAAGGASQPVFWSVPILGVCLGHFLLRRSGRDRQTEDPTRKRGPDQGSPQHAAWVKPGCEPNRNASCCAPDRS